MRRVSPPITRQNTTLAAVPNKSFKLNVWTNPTGTEDWCGETVKGVVNPATVATNVCLACTKEIALSSPSSLPLVFLGS